MLAGDVKDVSRKLDRAYAEAGRNFVGIGCTLEGLDVNPFMYEYVLDRAWTQLYDDAGWIDRLADRHSGRIDVHYRQAWQILYDKIYCAPSGNRSAAVCARPNHERPFEMEQPASRLRQPRFAESLGTVDARPAGTDSIQPFRLRQHSPAMS